MVWQIRPAGGWGRAPGGIGRDDRGGVKLGRDDRGGVRLGRDDKGGISRRTKGTSVYSKAGGTRVGEKFHSSVKIGSSPYK